MGAVLEFWINGMHGMELLRKVVVRQRNNFSWVDLRGHIGSGHYAFILVFCFVGGIV